MPPKKTYIFENIRNSNIRIQIESYTFERAYDLLVLITKYPENFKLTDETLID